MGVHEVNDVNDFNQQLKNAGGKTVFVDFSAEWCGPCKMIGPKFAAMEQEFPEAVFLKCDVDEVPEVAEQYEVSAMPTFKAFKNGVVVETLVGASEPKLREMIVKFK